MRMVSEKLKNNNNDDNMSVFGLSDSLNASADATSAQMEESYKRIKACLEEIRYGFINFLIRNSGSNMEENIWIAKNKKGNPFINPLSEKRS